MVKKKAPSQRDPPSTTVLVVEKDEDIRCSLQMLLEDEGYVVIVAHSLTKAEPLIDAAAEPMVLIVGNSEVVDYPALQLFMAEATKPATNYAYIYLTTMPEQQRLPELVRVLSTLEAQTMDMPFELETLLAVIADAAARLRS